MAGYRVTVGITTRNRPQQLRQALASVFEQTLRPLEVLVVDDASEPPLEPVSAPPDISLRWWRNERNQGLVVNRNELMFKARGKYFASLDDDAYFTTPEDLGTAANFLETHPEVAVLSFRTIEPPDLPSAAMQRNPASPKPCFKFRGGAHLLRLSVLSKSGHYRGFFYYVSEEGDLAYRLWEEGYQVNYFPQVQLVHDHPYAGGPSVQWAYFFARNGVLTILLNHPWLFQLISLPNFIIRTLIAYRRKHLLVPFFKGCIRAFGETSYIRKNRRPVSYRTMFTVLDLKRKYGANPWD